MIYPAPSYLAGIVTKAAKGILADIQKDYGDNTTAFKFNAEFNTLIQTWHNDYQEYGGTLWGIDTTGNKILLFDQFRHGYNAMMDLNEEEDLASTKSIELAQATEIIIAFQYSGDEDEYIDEGKSKHQQDYFGWVVIYKKIGVGLEELLSYECA